MKYLVFLSMLIAGFTCHSQEPNTCPEGVNVPDSLIGYWHRKTTRNNIDGHQAIEITNDCRFFYYEYGSGLFLSEWVKGLDADRKMEFSHARGQQISHITKDTLELSENKDLVTITDKSSGKVMQQWEMTSSYDQLRYRLINNGKTIVIPWQWKAGKLVEVEFKKSAKPSAF